MSKEDLAHVTDALSKIDWSARVIESAAQSPELERLVACNKRLAIWTKHIASCYDGNLSQPFIYEMQSASRDATSLAVLGLYRAACSSVRVTAECALYYVYFKDHPRELGTLIQNSKFYLSKSDLLEYIKMHIPDYKSREAVFGLTTKLNDWYKLISSYVHGQIPGEFPIALEFKDQAVNPASLKKFADLFEQGVFVTDALFKVALAPDIWPDISTAAKRYLVKGMTKAHRSALGLDVA